MIAKINTENDAETDWKASTCSVLYYRKILSGSLSSLLFGLLSGLLFSLLSSSLLARSTAAIRLLQIVCGDPSAAKVSAYAGDDRN